MDRQAFKQRMQNLKSYRENNPGKGYWDWKKAIQNYKGIDIDNDPTYDYYGFYKENPQTAKDILNDSEDAHFTDTYKTSVHPTFSNESKYSGYVNKYNPKGITGGYWGEDNSYNFSDSQIKNNWDVHDTLRYLEDAENYGVTAKYKNMYPKDVDNTIYGGVLPQVEIKAQVFAEGGEIGDASMEAIQQREWMNNWLNNRTKQMAENIDAYARQNRYGSFLDRIHVSPFFFQNKERNASKIIQEQLQYANDTPIYDFREPWVRADKNIPYRENFLNKKASALGTYYYRYKGPRAILIPPINKESSTILHELSHATQDKYSIQSSKIADILEKHEIENQPYDEYWDDPNEIYSRMNEFRYNKAINPEDTITREQIEQWKNSMLLKNDNFIKRYSTNTLVDLLNTVAMAFTNGGQTGDPDKERFYQATGRSSSGRPLEEGLKPVFSLEDAANMTPIGDTGIMPEYPIPSYKYGGIHIKKKNRGKFNALKKRTGKTTEELTHSKNPLTRKRAIFAQNAKKWKHKGRKKK